MEEVIVGQGMLAVGRRVAPAGLAERRSRLRTTWQIALPVLVVGLVLTGLIAARLEVYHGNVTGFVDFGQRNAVHTHPPKGAVVYSPWGYDGQFFYLQAHDPLLLHDSTVASLRAAKQAFRLQRMAYPALAFLAAGGSRFALPVALLAVNVLALLGLTALFAAYAVRRGWSVLWVIGLALMPGLLLPVLRDLSDTLATGCLVVGVLLAQSKRRWSAAAALTVAVLAREAAIAVVLALGIELAVRAWRARAHPDGWRLVLRQGCPIFAVPAVVFGLWQAYVALRYGGLVGTANAGVPGFDLIQEARWSIVQAPVVTYAVWDVLYVVLIVAGVLAALTSLRRGLTIPGLAACAAALGILIPTLGDPWSDTRLSGPLFALLLVDALERRRRATLVLCATVTGMTLLTPISIPGVF
jgi:hypothetical protein